VAAAAPTHATIPSPECKITVAASTPGLGVFTLCPGYACSWEADRRRWIAVSALAAGTVPGPAPIAGPGRVLRMPRVARRRAGSPLLCSVGTGASRCESHGHCHVGPALLGTSRRSSVTVHARVPHRSAASPQSVGQFRAGPRGRVSQLGWLRQASGHSSWAGRRAGPGQTGSGQAGPKPHRSHASRGPCRGPAGPGPGAGRLSLSCRSGY
jgi:hypothetical protein